MRKDEDQIDSCLAQSRDEFRYLFFGRFEANTIDVFRGRRVSCFGVGYSYNPYSQGCNPILRRMLAIEKCC